MRQVRPTDPDFEANDLTSGMAIQLDFSLTSSEMIFNKNHSRKKKPSFGRITGLIKNG